MNARCRSPFGVRRSSFPWLLSLLSVRCRDARLFGAVTRSERLTRCGTRPSARSLAGRFPKATSDDLLKARAYAYGGSVIQDLGYYPFGSHFFSNLLHYVRTGDFVER